MAGVEGCCKHGRHTKLGHNSNGSNINTLTWSREVHEYVYIEVDPEW